MENNTFLKLCVSDSQVYIIAGFPSVGYYVNGIICFVVNFIIAISTIFLNLATVLAYWKSPRLKKKISYFLIMVISLSDLAVGAIGSTSRLVLFTQTAIKQPSCVTAIALVRIQSIFCNISFNLLFILNLERYLCIVHPFFHRKNVTKYRLLIFIGGLCSVVVAETLAVGYFGTEGLVEYVLSFQGAFILLLLVYFNGRIFHTSRNRAVTNISNAAARREEKEFIRKLKLAKMCVIVIGGTVLCYMPIIVTSLFDQNDYNISTFTVWSMTFVLASSSLNSVVFFWRNPVLRKEAKEVLCNIKQR